LCEIGAGNLRHHGKRHVDTGRHTTAGDHIAAFLIYPDFQLLDAASPIAAFEVAERYRPGSYSLRVVAARPGLVASSAGVTAGIDLALALIAEDLGDQVARRTAQQLVVYYRRPGGQSQFSALLELERADGRFAPLLDYIRGNLAKRLSVTDLAQHSCMSPRHFARLFLSEVGVSPAKAVERLRVETARAALESGAQSNQLIARSCGFGTAERMRRSFLRSVGSTPSKLKRAKAPIR
jgi:transcriptional regulator GlxA family with amidase domain